MNTWMRRDWRTPSAARASWVAPPRWRFPSRCWSRSRRPARFSGPAFWRSSADWRKCPCDEGGGGEAKQMHKVTEHLLALQDWSVFLEHRNDDFIAVGLRRAALGELLQILIDFLLLLLMLVAFCERERTQFGVGYYPRAGENEKKRWKTCFL